LRWRRGSPKFASLKLEREDIPVQPFGLPRQLGTGAALAARWRRVALVMALVTSPTALRGETFNVHAPSPSDIGAYSGLHGLVWREFRTDLELWLINGAPPDGRDAGGRTPFILAAHRGDAEAMRVLRRFGADPTARDAMGLDALTVAAASNRLPAVVTALRLGADPRGAMPDGRTALMAAAAAGHADVVRALVKAGAPVDQHDHRGRTALVFAVAQSDGEPRFERTVAALLEAGADPEHRDAAGESPLTLATQRGLTTIAERLRLGRGR
jgi:ankyrin repeat protein